MVRDVTSLLSVQAPLTGWRLLLHICAHHEQAGIILLLALPLPYVPPALVICVLTLAFSVALTFPFVPANPSTRPRKKEGRLQASP